MSVKLDIQKASNSSSLPTHSLFQKWVDTVLRDFRDEAELTIRIVGENEGKALNEQWRRSRGPTNVLSFPAEGNEPVVPDFLGDIVICAPVIEMEAEQQGKTSESHWAHMVIHGTLHLLGFDHQNKEDAEKMESIEIKLLNELGYRNPYE